MLRASLLALPKNPRRNHLRFYCMVTAKQIRGGGCGIFRGAVENKIFHSGRGAIELYTTEHEILGLWQNKIPRRTKVVLVRHNLKKRSGAWKRRGGKIAQTPVNTSEIRHYSPEFFITFQP